MTDAELDRDWVPNGRRPLSTVARSFSQELMDIFRIDNSVSDLDQQVSQRRETVGKNNQELADLEARIREMEDRLNRNQGAKPARPSQQSSNIAPTSAPSRDENKSRPGTARAPKQAPSSGNMPPTPGASEGDYRLVARAHLHDPLR
ncbi:uncharacterized protein MAM_02873 [Metarhizium album ARSEF 1941]|uniref:Uncharacterized protein n=1 Tax=Metarhizium album (strain ARSEF 1941) TaxID=1081103 RepID=A0A0B2X1Y7_METAS|nr:uncharacterized protein MAM_02873 [Metarhizium album ARSEF 1941]KHN99175.1 hypothetical protein MAM_02873 [Metarhizium album ARSEF 1941]